MCRGCAGSMIHAWVYPRGGGLTPSGPIPNAPLFFFGCSEVHADNIYLTIDGPPPARGRTGPPGMAGSDTQRRPPQRRSGRCFDTGGSEKRSERAAQEETSHVLKAVLRGMKKKREIYSGPGLRNCPRVQVVEAYRDDADEAVWCRRREREGERGRNGGEGREGRGARGKGEGMKGGSEVGRERREGKGKNPLGFVPPQKGRATPSYMHEVEARARNTRTRASLRARIAPTRARARSHPRLSLPVSPPSYPGARPPRPS
ncbi:hypothetical protein DFH08DRAFT_807280 [Mycena albidolilacea]|uniref:Uncharacterized protein n=1 Tax=Mycena albidolilacea TaxID=1033008 RepID=A0AAD7A5Q1_9AGAR|nr:hypothetical protein DFH08DRAFT_807280 [Mycena albidolilacea]